VRDATHRASLWAQVDRPSGCGLLKREDALERLACVAKPALPSHGNGKDSCNNAFQKASAQRVWAALGWGVSQSHRESLTVTSLHLHLPHIPMALSKNALSWLFTRATRHEEVEDDLERLPPGVKSPVTAPLLHVGPMGQSRSLTHPAGMARPRPRPPRHAWALPTGLVVTLLLVAMSCAAAHGGDRVGVRRGLAQAPPGDPNDVEHCPVGVGVSAAQRLKAERDFYVRARAGGAAGPGADGAQGRRQRWSGGARARRSQGRRSGGEAAQVPGGRRLHQGQGGGTGAALHTDPGHAEPSDG
jgi:hypothetical protein